MRAIQRSIVLCAGLLMLVPSLASAKTLDEAMVDIAGDLAKQLKKNRAEVVQVTVDSPPGDAASKRMQKSFVDALRAANDKLEISSALPDFKLVLKYRRSDDSDDYAMEVEWRDENNKVLGKFPTNFQFADATEQAAVEGSIVDNTIDDAGKPTQATKEVIQENLSEKPNAFVSLNEEAGGVESILSAQEGSKFRIEILAKPASAPPGPQGYVPKGIRQRKGFALCGLEDEEVYAVRIYNDASHAVAVDLQIDGLNMWILSKVPAWKAGGKFFVPAGGVVTMRGWHTGDLSNPHEYHQFKIVEFPDSVVEQLGADQSAMGQISAQFFAAWLPGQEQPVVDPVPVQGDSTGLGQADEMVTENKTAFIGKSLLAAVTVRYTRPESDDLPGADNLPPN